MKPKVEKLDCSEGSLQSLNGRNTIGTITQKEEMDASMPLKRPTFDEKVGKVKKIVEFKYEVLKLTRVHLR
jgi:hypothetical protein